MTVYRNDLPPIPSRISTLPVQNGFPVPYFVAQVNGVYDFRVMDSAKLKPALQNNLCWVCGQKLGTTLAFTIGPMCAISRTISEPPSHRQCAEWSAKACPFLTQRQEERRETRLPENLKEPAGFGIKRQPGAVCVWLTDTFEVFKVPEEFTKQGAGSGILFELGEPFKVLWFKQGRAATREEILESINSGYHHLLELAQAQGAEAVAELERRRAETMKLLPQEESHD